MLGDVAGEHRRRDDADPGCQRSAESPHFGACNFPHLAGTAISRLSDQALRFLAVDRDA